MEVVYEDNHIIIVNKACGEIVQGDRTGDEPLVETLKQWIKVKYNKPGNVFCGVTHRIDYDRVLEIARECKPKLIVAGASAYPRIIDFARLRSIADEVGAYLMVDMAHIAGLVAAG